VGQCRDRRLQLARPPALWRLRTLAIAGDPALRILTTTYVDQAHYFRGEYERAVELATENVAALPTDAVYEHFGLPAPASVFDRIWLVESLAQLGRFVEAAGHEAEMMRLAESTQQAFTRGIAHYAAGLLRLVKGDWVTARSLTERGLVIVPLGTLLFSFRGSQLHPAGCWRSSGRGMRQ
jgi:hypothetical protein